MIGSQVTDPLLNSMQYSPAWEADSSLANWQTLYILSNPKVHHVCNSLPHVSPLSQISPIHVCHPVSSGSVLMLSNLLCLVLPNGHSVWVSWSKAMHNSCCHAVMLFSTWLYHLWEWFLDFIASEFCFVWLCNEVFVKWSVLWSKVLLQFHMSDCGLVTVAWDSSKICLFCTVGMEAVLYDFLSQLVWCHYCGDWKVSYVLFMIWLPWALHVLMAW
jgi:hypothetical protein